MREQNGGSGAAGGGSAAGGASAAAATSDAGKAKAEDKKDEMVRINERVLVFVWHSQEIEHDWLILFSRRCKF